jgi:hypothetical protein
MIAVSDEAGLHRGGNGGDEVTFCRRIDLPVIDSILAALHSLGSRHIDELCYQGSIALIARKGTGVVLDEQVGKRHAEGVLVRASVSFSCR